MPRAAPCRSRCGGRYPRLDPLLLDKCRALGEAILSQTLADIAEGQHEGIAELRATVALGGKFEAGASDHDE